MTVGQRSGLQAAVQAVLLVLVCLTASVDARASVLEVQGVSVDITADSAAAAREQAIVEAQRKAFAQLVAEMTGGGQPPAISDEDIASLVRDFSIVSEKSSAVRYIATFDFRFNESGVRRLLGRYDAPVVARAEPVVVVPVYQSDSALALWDDPNPWRQAWAAQGAGGVARTVVPPGSLTDIATIGPDQAIAGDVQALSELAQQYGTGGALVAYAVLEAGPERQQPAVTVTTVRYGRGVEQARSVQTVEANAGETTEALLQRAVAAVKSEMQGQGTQQTASGPPGILAVNIPVTGLSDWLSMRNRLRTHPMIGETDLVSLSRDQVRLDLHYRGSLDELTTALRQYGLDLSRDGVTWVLRPAGVGGL